MENSGQMSCLCKTSEEKIIDVMLTNAHDCTVLDELSKHIYEETLYMLLKDGFDD